MSVAELCRRHDISHSTYCQRKSRYAGMSVNELKKDKELEADGARLQRMYAGLVLKNAGIQGVLSRRSGRR